MVNTLTILQHNVLAWTQERRQELSNTYLRLNPDIILINSTGITNDSLFKLFTYKTYHKNFARENHAGIAIAVRYNIKHKLINNFIDDTLAIQVDTDIGPVIIATSYIPPRRNYLPVQDITSILRRPIPAYILGDLNLRHTLFGHNDNNNRGTAMADIVNQGRAVFWGPDFPTLRVGRGKPDMIFTNTHANLNYLIEKGNLTTSDHLPIIFKISSRPIKIADREHYKTKRMDWLHFKNHIQNQYTTNPFIEQDNLSQFDINNSLSSWLNKIKTAREETVPKGKISFNSFPLFNDRINLQIQAYNNLLAQQRNGIIPFEYRNLINYYQLEIRLEFDKLSKDHWESLLRELAEIYKIPKEFWNKVKMLKGNNKNATPAFLVREDGTQVNEPEEQIEVMREAWEQVFQITPLENASFDLDHEVMVNEVLRQNNDKTTPFHRSDLTRLSEDNYLLRKVQPHEFISTLKTFKHKAPGSSGIGKIYLENIPMESVTEICHIYNTTSSMGYFPAMFKEGAMALLTKENPASSDPLKYRPITLLETVGKIFEKIMRNRLIRFIDENNLNHPNQFGFRKGHGTQAALGILHENISLYQQNKYNTNVVSRDISKAFDKVWHKGLKYKLIQTTLPSPFVNLLCNFLDNRKVKIKFKNLLSNYIYPSSGVPQGSVLSPTLFNFYTHDIPPSVHENSDMCFADDITQVIMYPMRSRRGLAEITSHEINRINDFETKWKIKTNKNKFKLISISKKSPHPVTVNNRIIPFTNSAVILGQTIRRTGASCHFRQHLAMAKKNYTTLKRFHKLQPKMQAHLFKAFILPIIEYPITPLCTASNSNIKKIQGFQNRFLRKLANQNIDTINLNIEEIHRKFKFEATNERLFRLADKAWNKIEEINPELVERSNENILNDHFWWKRIAPYIARGPPVPIYQYN